MENRPQLLRRKQVQSLTGLGRSTIYEAMAQGRFPSSIKIGARGVAWVASEVDAWIAARIADSRSGTAGELRR
jgi:prophage regulatory protein